MNRRYFIRSAGLALTHPALVRAADAMSDGWRTFELTTRVEILRPSGTTRVWLPTALIGQTVYQRTLSNEFKAEGGTARIIENRPERMGIVVAEFAAGVPPVVTLTSRVATKNHLVDLSAPSKKPAVNRAELAHFLRPTRLLPLDGVVKAKAEEITRGGNTDLDKARAIYDWIVENTFRNPKTRGCGVGDIRFMLESGDLSGKCADLNALFVGLARAAGLPARDAYGIRIAGSELGYKSLGTSSENVSKSQHCRAEVWIGDHGWVPVDPADVRKVVLEEPPGNRPL